MTQNQDQNSGSGPFFVVGDNSKTTEVLNNKF